MSLDVSRVWAGVEDAQRKARWSERIDKKLLDWKLTMSSLSPAVLEEIELQLQPGFFTAFTPPLSAKDFDDLRLVLRMDAAFNHRTTIADGQAQLCARLLSVFSYDTRLAFATLQSLNSQLKLDTADANRYKVDALTLTSLLSRDLPELTTHLNAAQFDVVDLTDMLTTFLPCAYALSFPGELVARCVDVMLLDPLGTSFLFSVLYGVLRVNVKTIVQQSPDSVFQFIADLPSTMTKQQSADALAHAYKAVRARAEQVNAERKKKSWTHAIAQPGPILFSAEVGDATAPPAPPRTALTSGASSAAVSYANSGATTPGGPSSPRSLGVGVGEGSVTFNLKDLSTDRPGSRGPGTAPVPSTASVLQALAAGEKEADVGKLRELVRLAQSHLRATAVPPPLPSSGPSSSSSLSPFPSAPLPPSKTPSSSTVKYAELHEYLPLPCTHMEGFLLKSRQASKFLGMKTKAVKSSGHSTMSSGLFGVTLHRRLFVLEGDFLSYFKGRGDSAPSRGEALWVRCCWVEELSEREFGQWGFGFEVRMKVKGAEKAKGVPATEPLFVLFTNSAKERQTWVDVLRRATGQA